MQLPVDRNIQIARIFLHATAIQRALDHISIAAPHLLLEIEHRLLPMRLLAERRRAELHAAGENDIEIPHESVHVLGVLHVQHERRREIQVFLLHRVDIQILRVEMKKNRYENAACVGNGLRFGNDIHEGLEQSDLFDRVHFKAVHVVPNYHAKRATCVQSIIS